MAAAPAAQNPNPDLEGWTKRFNEVVSKPSEVINSKSADSAHPWNSALFGCFDPIDLCLMTWCLPCVTFGKTHHRVHKNGSLEGYEPVNTSCLLLCGSACVGLSCIPLAMQRSEVRKKYHLQGSCIEDILLSCCCGCCSLVQQDKEAASREPLMGDGGGVKQQYQTGAEMVYPQPGQAPQ